MAFFLGYSLHSRAYCVLIIETNRIIETCEVTFDETAPCSSSSFEIAGDDELGTTLFEEEDEVDGDPRAFALAAASGPSAESFEDEGGPRPTTSTTVELPSPLPAQAPAGGGPAEDAGEVTSDMHAPRKV